MPASDYPEAFYGEGYFGAWPLHHPHVEYRCSLVLARVNAYLERKDTNQTALHNVLMWEADRCLCDHPDTLAHDRIKFSFEHHWHTQAARDRYAANKGPKGLTFEHAVPRLVVFTELVRRVGSSDADERLDTWQKVRDFLRPLRAIALITVEEDKEFNRRQANGRTLRQSMPSDWTWKEPDPFARYKVVADRFQLIRPTPPSSTTVSVVGPTKQPSRKTAPMRRTKQQSANSRSVARELGRLFDLSADGALGIRPVVSDDDWARFIPHSWAVPENLNPNPPSGWGTKPSPYVLVEVGYKCRLTITLGHTPARFQEKLFALCEGQDAQSGLKKAAAVGFRKVYNPVVSGARRESENDSEFAARLYAGIVAHLMTEQWKRIEKGIAGAFADLHA